MRFGNFFLNPRLCKILYSRFFSLSIKFQGCFFGQPLVLECCHFSPGYNTTSIKNLIRVTSGHACLIRLLFKTIGRMFIKVCWNLDSIYVSRNMSATEICQWLFVDWSGLLSMPWLCAVTSHSWKQITVPSHFWTLHLLALSMTFEKIRQRHTLCFLQYIFQNQAYYNLLIA